MRQALFLLMLLALMPAQAETVYISDVLRVGVRAQPNSSDTPITVVTSGTELTVLERQAGHLRVRTSGGVEGWISEVYATSELPAQLRLERMEQERDRLQQELAQLRSSSSASGAQVEQLTARIEALQAENSQLQSRMAELQAQLQEEGSAYGWLYYAAALIVLFALGVYLGVRWDKERVAQRLGGLEL
ncbi:TIGR04211 family SH3 domain-containing protein [Sulfurivermis fontis]|uniref:TIGR04211 family SH3 domain-containing protein n=1 Tax=Sulfurivermis fontis TaxID=1972068 RepID=UPI000FD900F7|nr:TIGR04211 family SH3 domain-containing protein [Sulfurivermis fontis]